MYQVQIIEGFKMKVVTLLLTLVMAGTCHACELPREEEVYSYLESQELTFQERQVLIYEKDFSTFEDTDFSSEEKREKYFAQFTKLIELGIFCADCWQYINTSEFNEQGNLYNEYCEICATGLEWHE